MTIEVRMEPEHGLSALREVRAIVARHPGLFPVSVVVETDVKRSVITLGEQADGCPACLAQLGEFGNVSHAG